MSFLPEIIITQSPDEALIKKKIEYPDAMVLYLLNKNRFCSIGVGTLYDAVQKMDRYGFGKKYGVVDVLTNFDNTNPDKLFSLLFLFMQIDLDYRKGLYGQVLRKIKEHKKVLNVSKYTVKQHADKSVVKKFLESVLSIFENGKEKIIDFLNHAKEMDMINAEYLDEIIGDEDYANVLEIPLQEFHNLVDYLQNPHISTQHGVKGESHDTVIFMADNSSHEPIVNITKFFELWSAAEVRLSEFELFYYEYKKMLKEIESIIGMKSSDMKKEDYVAHKEYIYQIVNAFSEVQSENDYYQYLLKPVVQKYLDKEGVTSAKACLKGNLVYGALSAYKLFYVGCSRARRNLSIIIDKKDIQGFEKSLVNKFEQCGFRVIAY